MIQVIAIITALPGKRQAILDEIRPRLATVRAEAGCLEYTVTVDADVVGPMHSQTKFGPDTFVTIEKWESLKHLEAHSTAPYVPGYFAIVGPLMASRVVHFLSSAV